MDILSLVFETGFWLATVRMATPLIFGTMGELICERAGVLNLGIEGIMAAGCMSGWTWVYLGGTLWGGVLFAAAVGAGLGITMLGASLSSFAFRMLLPQVTTPPKITPFAPLDIPVLSDLPFLGPVLFSQTALTLLAFALVGITAYILLRTPLGLALRMVGENPLAAEAQGLSVLGLRTGAVMAGSALMAVGGAFLTLAAFDAYYIGMVNGRGWICIALVVFSSWKPGKALLGALLFAAFDAIQMRVQQQSMSDIPYQFYLMLPYLCSILALITMSRKAAYPKALLIPFRKGER
jgi:simple sugar transport system permease protein